MASSASSSSFRLSLDEVRPRFVDCQLQTQQVAAQQRTGAAITVVQMNILAGNLASAQHFPYVVEESLRWETRRRTLLRELDELDADVVCLEELSDYWTFFKPQLQERGYESVYVKRPSIHDSTWSGAKKQDGCGIFYKKQKFELKECESINYHDKHDRVALLAMLKMQSLAQFVIVGCTHLWWNAKNVDHQVAELGELEQELIRMRSSVMTKYEDELQKAETGSTHVPIILCGDFNNSPESPVYEYMQKTFMQQAESGGVRETFKSAYEYYQQNLASKTEPSSSADDSTEPEPSQLTAGEGNHGEPPHTTVNYRRCWTIDYIWYSSSTLVPRRVLAIPPERILRAEAGPANWQQQLAARTDSSQMLLSTSTECNCNRNGIPNSKFGSDHVPLMADVEFLHPDK